MTTGWAEFLQWIRYRVSEDQYDPAATWSNFEKLSENSERAEILQIVRRCGSLLPERERYFLVFAVTCILAPIEWSRAMEQVRPALVAALNRLVIETDPEVEKSFFAAEVEVLEAGGQLADVQRVAHVLLISARDLLRAPCRRDELPVVARLCNSAHGITIREYRRVRKPEEEATRRMRDAMVAYAEAADAVNAAMGAVLFEGLHAPLEEAF